MTYREPRPDERDLLQRLATAAPEVAGGIDWVPLVQVEPMSDGGMGSLRLRVQGNLRPRSGHLRVASEMQFADQDGVAVLASLYVDESNWPLEVDMWKVTNAPLIQMPASLPQARRPDPPRP